MKLLKILIFILSTSLISCSSSTDNSNNKTMTKIDAKDLYNEIKENTMAAELRYLDKKIIVTNCYNKGIEKRWNHVTSKEDEWCVFGKSYIMDHLFFIRNDQMKILLGLKSGQIFRVSGLVVEVADERVVMEDCIILPNEDGSYIWKYDITETAYSKMRAKEKKALLKEQLEREKEEMKMLQIKAEEERRLSDDKDEVLKTIDSQAEENEADEALRLQEEYYNSQTKDRLKWEKEQEEIE
jgi:hypothetical protein